MTTQMSELPPLSPEERSSAYAKYYRDPVPPDPTHLSMMDTPCDPTEAL